MADSLLAKLVKFIIAAVLNLIAVLLPYKPRLYFINALAFIVHLPFVIFGKMVRYFFKVLEIDPDEIK